MPRSGRERTEEILCRRALLPPDLVHDPAYAVNSQLWDMWLEMEHDHRRRLAFAAVASEDYVPEEEDNDGGDEPPIEEEEDDDDALKQAIEASELEELGLWPDLATTLCASA